MLAEFEYTAVDSVAAAVAALSATANGRPLAGGHGLLTAMKRRREILGKEVIRVRDPVERVLTESVL